jgi:hypothetical protein
VKSGLYRALKERIEGREARETRGGGRRRELAVKEGRGNQSGRRS